MPFWEKPIEMFADKNIELRSDAPALMAPLVKSLIAAAFPMPWPDPLWSRSAQGA